MSRKYVIGLDYGTESGRALLVAVDTGEERGCAIVSYAHGVIDTALPGTGEKLPPDWALQDPRDYIEVLETAIPQVLREAGVDGNDVIGIGVDFTACTLVPVDHVGTALSMKPGFEANKHAWVKLWKHHGAQQQADRINALAMERGEPFLPRYGGKVSSEWLFPKALQILEEAPEVYAAADQFVEAGDWIVFLLTGVFRRNACAAGYKACWDEGYPSPEFWRAVNPAFENIVKEKVRGEVRPTGERAGGLKPGMAARLGLAPGTAVAVAGIDAHVAVPSSTVTGPGKMVMIMGTSLCHMVCGEEKHIIDGLCGVVKDGILPGLYGYEAGQAAVGDIFAWFVNNCVPAGAAEAARAEGLDIHAYLGREAAKLAVGESGVLCLDWWNGNRSILVDSELSGLMVGMTLGTTPAEMYRAVLESTAYGTYKIIQQCEAGGCAIHELYACGGMPGKNPPPHADLRRRHRPRDQGRRQRPDRRPRQRHVRHRRRRCPRGRPRHHRRRRPQDGPPPRHGLPPRPRQPPALRHPLHRIRAPPRPLRPRHRRHHEDPQGSEAERPRVASFRGKIIPAAET
jgi:L-ribulokinase